MRLLVAVLATVVFFIIAVILTRTVAGAARGNARGVAAVTGFAGVNAVNLCAPGWCAHYGMPFRYYGWSDAIIIFNGVELSPAGFSLWALAADALVALGIFVIARKLHGSRG